MDAAHSGPCAVYLKKVEHANADNNAAGDGWFKIWHEGFDEAAGKFCTNKMIDNNGHLAVKIPSDIQQGYYLLRPELLALHAALESPPDPQFYSNCLQLYVESSGNAQPATVAIPGHIPENAPGLSFDIYKSPLALPFPMFGPAPYGSGEAPAAGPVSPSASTPATPVNSNVAGPSGSAASGSGSGSGAGTGAGSGASDDSDAEESDDVESADNEAEDESADNEAEDEDEDEEDSSDECDADEEDEEDAEDAEDPADADDAPEAADADDAPEAADVKDDEYSDDETSGSTPATPPSGSAGSGTSGSTSPSSAAGNTPSTGAAPTTPAPNGQTEGLKPANCVLVNANWCGFEVPAYSSADACWTSSKNCWDQSQACFDQAPPTGAWNCEIWNTKCNALDDACNGGSSSGPANAGKDLTPPPPSLVDSKVKRMLAAVKRQETHVMRRAFRGSME